MNIYFDAGNHSIQRSISGMGGFEVSMLLNVVSLRQNPVRLARGASRYISSVLTLFLGYLYHASGSYLLLNLTRQLLSYFSWLDAHTMKQQVLNGANVDDKIASRNRIASLCGEQRSNMEAENKVEGHTFCTSEVQTMIPLLREVYDDSMTKVLYVGPDTCLMMSELLLDEEDYEAWGVEPYGSDASNLYCWDLIHKGIIRVADMKFSLPYREKSFSHVIISDTLEYFSSRYLNNTIPELMRVSRDGVIIFAGYPDYPLSEFTRYKFNRQAKLRSPSWWKRYLVQRKLEENEAAKKRFKKILRDISYKPACQIFFLKSG
ncbi:unnamed protein product [Citrullus colocynthis]|uniref:Methyltransferase type 11 domain-containing protein n=1 Tax=Citrullus colocynthis TaxID=252529 RepID=A0ABP0YNS9_9ROSI